MSFCVVCPSLPPKIDGLADYSYNLYRNWPSSTSGRLPSHFLVLDDFENSSKALPDLRIHRTGRTAQELASALSAIDANLVLVQYSGYAYDRHGAPEWLPEGLSLWKNGATDRRCAVMFHELFASAAVWRRTFWHSIRQKSVATKLLKLASVAVTTNEYYRGELLKLDSSSSPVVIPIGTNFSGGQDTEKNWHQAVIFGRSRKAAIAQHSALLKCASEAGSITSLLLAGECAVHTREEEARIVRATGFQGALETAYNFSDLPDQVRQAGIALMATQSTYLHKSGAFHLAIASGQVAITTREHPPGHPLQEGTNYLAYDRNRPDELLPMLRDEPRLQAISSSAHSTAIEHFSWDKIAEAWCQLLEREKTTC